MMNLKYRIGCGIVLIGTALGVSGCLEAAARGYGSSAKTPRQAHAWEIVSELAGVAERREHEMGVAREGRTQIIINEEPQEQKYWRRPSKNPNRNTTYRRDGRFSELYPGKDVTKN